jgi:SnoaL-like domain
MPSITEDRDSILQLLYTYNHAIDGGDAERWADTFTADGALNAAGRLFAGRDELIRFASGVHGMRHVVTNPVVEVDGDKAAVQAYVLVFRGPSVSVIGTYADELVRTPAGWRFVRRDFTPETWDTASTETLRAVGQESPSGPR